MIRYPSVEEFVAGYLSATPVAGIVAKLDEPTRAAILQEVKTSLQPYMDDDVLAAPIEAHVLVANKWWKRDTVAIPGGRGDRPSLDERQPAQQQAGAARPGRPPTLDVRRRGRGGGLNEGENTGSRVL